MDRCASCGAPTNGTYRCLECERAAVAADKPDAAALVTLDEPAVRLYRPIDVLSALVTLGVSRGRGGVGRTVGLVVTVLVVGVIAYAVVLVMAHDVSGW